MENSQKEQVIGHGDSRSNILEETKGRDASPLPRSDFKLDGDSQSDISPPDKLDRSDKSEFIYDQPKTTQQRQKYNYLDGDSIDHGYEEVKVGRLPEDPQDAYQLQIKRPNQDLQNKFSKDLKLQGAKKKKDTRRNPQNPYKVQDELDSSQQTYTEAGIFQNTLSNMHGKDDEDGNSPNRISQDDSSMNLNHVQEVRLQTQSKLRKYLRRHKYAIIITTSIIISLIAIGLGILAWQIMKLKQTDQCDKRYPALCDPALSSFMSLDKTTGNLEIDYPITQQQYLAAIKSGLLQKVPLKFELNEECNYTANITFSVESDALAQSPLNGVDQYVDYNVSFYTTNLQQDSITVVVYYLQSDGSSNNAAADTNFTTHTDSVISADSQKELEYYSNLTQDTYNNVDPSTFQTEQEQMDYLVSTTKIAKCQLDFYGNFTSCAFNVNMSTSDQQLAVKFLRMYVPSLDLSMYSGKRRLVELDNLNSQSQQGSISAASGSTTTISHSSDSQNNSDSGNLNAKMSDNSNHNLDVSNGKIGASSKAETYNYSPSPTQNLQKGQSAVSKIDSTGAISFKLISRRILTQTQMDADLQKISYFNYTTVTNPEATFKNTATKVNNASASDNQNSNATRRILKERHLESNESESDFQELDLVLGKVNLLVTTLSGGFGFVCPDNDHCDAGIYFELDPLPQIWPLYRSVPAELGSILRAYRYVKLVFQTNIEIMKNLTDDITTAVDFVIYSSLDDVDQELQLFEGPMNDAYLALDAYINNTLQTAIALNESLDMVQSINDALDQYSAQTLSQLLGNFDSQIDTAAAGFYDNLITLQSQIISSGLNYTNDTFQYVQSQKYYILGAFDSVIDVFEDGWIDYLRCVEGIYGQVYDSLLVITDSTSFTGSQAQYVQPVLNIVLQSFDSLSSTLQSDIDNLYEGFRTSMHLYHAKKRHAIEAIFENMLNYLQYCSGTDTLTQSQTASLDLSIYSAITSLVTIDYTDVLEANGDVLLEIIAELQAGVTENMYQTILNLETVATASDSNSDLSQITISLNKKITLLEYQISSNITSVAAIYYNTFVADLKAVTDDLESLPGNIQSSFDQDDAQDSGVVNLNSELNDIDAMITEVQDIMANFESLIDIEKQINTRISQLKTDFQAVVNGPANIQSKFNQAVAQIKSLESQLGVTFTLPSNHFSFLAPDFQTIETQMLNQAEGIAINTAKQLVKQVGIQFGDAFLATLEEALSKKLASILPSSLSTSIFTKGYTNDLTLFETEFPLPIGRLLIEADQQFVAAIHISLEMKGTSLALVVDPYTQMGYVMRLAYDLMIARLGASISAIIFDGHVTTAVGIALNALTPTLYMTSTFLVASFYLEFALVYQYLTVNIKWVCFKLHCVKICIPIPMPVWTDWETIVSYRQLLGPSYEKTFLDVSYSVTL